TWYTGSAGWMYQFITNSLLGMELQKDYLKFNPCFPLHWPSISIVYRYKTSTYRIKVFQTETDDSSWKMDDDRGSGDTIQLNDDGAAHEAEVFISISAFVS
ncbi:MAG: hypothetical protein ABI480_10305, partial [Chitinophagaceae bacterium]